MISSKTRKKMGEMSISSVISNKFKRYIAIFGKDHTSDKLVNSTYKPCQMFHEFTMMLIHLVKLLSKESMTLRTKGIVHRLKSLGIELITSCLLGNSFSHWVIIVLGTTIWCGPTNVGEKSPKSKLESESRFLICFWTICNTSRTQSRLLENQKSNCQDKGCMCII